MLSFIDFDAFFDTPGYGGLVAGTIIATLLLTYGLTLRWVAKGQADEDEEA